MVTFTEEVINRKLHILRSVKRSYFLGVFVFLDTRPSALILGPRPSAPILSVLGPQNIARTNLWISILHIQDYTYSTLKYYTYSRYSKSYLERPSYGVQNKWRGFSLQQVFFINNKRNGKKLYAEIHSLSSQLYGCS